MKHIARFTLTTTFVLSGSLIIVTPFMAALGTPPSFAVPCITAQMGLLSLSLFGYFVSVTSVKDTGGESSREEMIQELEELHQLLK